MSSKAIAAYLASLIKVSTYAKQEDVSVTEAGRRIKAGKLESIEIDGVRFVVLPPAPTGPRGTAGA